MICLKVSSRCSVLQSIFGTHISTKRYCVRTAWFTEHRSDLKYLLEWGVRDWNISGMIGERTSAWISIQSVVGAYNMCLAVDCSTAGSLMVLNVYNPSACTVNHLVTIHYMRNVFLVRRTLIAPSASSLATYKWTWDSVIINCFLHFNSYFSL